MNDFIGTELALEYHARLARDARAARLVKAAHQAGGDAPRRTRRRLRFRPHNQ